jgi:uncharacterized membrane protein YraQ (UPF0718 family)
MERKRYVHIGIVALFLVFIVISSITRFDQGMRMAVHFKTFLLTVLRIVPCVFVLIGLFEVWVRRESVERQLGATSGLKGYTWAILLAATTVGGLFVAFPVAHALNKKGARPSAIYTYLSASTVFRIPMTLFEASFMGMKFTIIRMATALPLIVFTSMLLERIVQIGGDDSELPT